MKRKSLFAALMVCGLSANAAQVEVVVNATITNIDDYMNGLSHLNIGSSLTYKYVYNSDAEDMDIDPQMGRYAQETGLNSVEVTLGNTVFTTQPTDPMFPPQGPIFNIDINANEALYGDWYAVMTTSLQLNNNVQIDGAYVYLDGLTNENVIDSDVLTETPPNLASFNSFKEVHLTGSSNGYFFNVMAQIDTMDANVVTPAPGTSFTYTGTARVAEIMDGPLVLDGRVAMNDIVNFEYTVNTSVVDSNPDTNNGVFLHPSNFGNLKLTLTDGTLVESNQTFEVHTWLDSYSNDFSLDAANPSVSGVPIDIEYMFLHMNSSSPVLTDDSIPLDKMNPVLWESANIVIDNWMAGLSMRAEILTIESAVQTDVVLAPGNFTAHPMQNFDVAIRHTLDGQYASMSATVNGQNADAYLQSCIPFAPVESTVTLLCPEANTLLLPGTNTFQVDFLLYDQSVVSKSVEWTVAP